MCDGKIIIAHMSLDLLGGSVCLGPRLTFSVMVLLAWLAGRRCVSRHDIGPHLNLDINVECQLRPFAPATLCCPVCQWFLLSLFLMSAHTEPLLLLPVENSSCICSSLRPCLVKALQNFIELLIDIYFARFAGWLIVVDSG